MWDVDFHKLGKWLGSIGAKLLLLVFITPFVIMAAASVYALAGSQLGTGWAKLALVAFILLVGYIVNHWVWLLGK